MTMTMTMTMTIKIVKVTIIFGFFKADPASALTRTDSVFLSLSNRVVHLHCTEPHILAHFGPSDPLWAILGPLGHSGPLWTLLAIEDHLEAI